MTAPKDPTLAPAPEPVPTQRATSVAWSVAVLAGASLLTGLGCTLKQVVTDFGPEGSFVLANYQACLELVLVGAAPFVPGLSMLKAGPFARR